MGVIAHKVKTSKDLTSHVQAKKAKKNKKIKGGKLKADTEIQNKVAKKKQKKSLEAPEKLQECDKGIITSKLKATKNVESVNSKKAKQKKKTKGDELKVDTGLETKVVEKKSLEVPIKMQQKQAGVITDEAINNKKSKKKKNMTKGEKVKVGNGIETKVVEKKASEVPAELKESKTGVITDVAKSSKDVKPVQNKKSKKNKTKGEELKQSNGINTKVVGKKSLKVPIKLQQSKAEVITDEAKSSKPLNRVNNKKSKKKKNKTKGKGLEVVNGIETSVGEKKSVEVPEKSKESEMGVKTDEVKSSKDLNPIINKKSKKKQNKTKGEELEVGTGVVTKVVEQAIEGVRHLENEKPAKKSKKSLLDDDTEEKMIFLQVAMVKVSNLQRRAASVVKPVKMKIFLPNPVVNSSTDVLLITKDGENEHDIRDDHTDNLYHYQQKLKRCGAARHISEVVTLRQLKVEFKEYEAKRHLANRTNVVLCDDTIVRRIPMFLGKHFYQKRKFPIPVNLKTKNLLSEIERCLTIEILYLPMKGNSGVMKIGCLSQSNEVIIENIQAAVKKMVKNFPGGWKNVHALYLKTEKSQSVPFYAKLRSPNDIKNIVPKPLSKQKAVSDEVSTDYGKIYTVNPDNTIRYKKEGKKDEEEQLVKEISKTSEENKRKLEESGEENLKKKKKKKSAVSDDSEVVKPAEEKKKSSDKKASKKKDSKADKKKKRARDDVDPDEEDENRLNKMEVEYLKKLKGLATEEVKDVPSDDEVDDWAEGSDEDLGDDDEEI